MDNVNVIDTTASVTNSHTYYLTVGGTPHLITNDIYPVISGITAPNAEVDFFDRNTEISDDSLPPDQQFAYIGSAFADEFGNYTYDFKVLNEDRTVDTTASTSLFPDGTYNIGITVTDMDGTYAALDTIVLEVDTSTSAPFVYSLDTDRTSLADGAAVINGVVYTKYAAPAILGYAETGSTVAVRDVSDPLHVVEFGTALANGTLVNGQSRFTFQVDTAHPLTQGAHTLNFIATDRAGNPSSETTFVVGIDSATLVPEVGVQNSVTSPGGVEYSKFNTPTFTGVAEPGATVAFTDQAGNALGSATADANGNYTFTQGTPLTDGAKTITAKAIDALGNTKTTSHPVTIDTQIAAPTTSMAAPGLTVGGVNYNLDNKPTITGVAEAGATVTVKEGTTVVGSAVATAVVIGSNNYSITLASALTDGPHSLKVFATDLAGNVSTEVTQSVTIDTQAPTTLTKSLASPAVTAGGVTYDRDNTPTITGNTEAGVTVAVKDGATLLGTTLADASGNYSFTPADSKALSEGGHTLNVTATDAAGNVSSVASQSVTIDTLAPNAPSLSLSSAVTSGGVLYDKVNTPTISGAAEAGATVTFKDGTTLLGSTVAGTNNSYSFALTNALSDGVHTLNLTATDAAGNVSTVTSQSVTIDTALPTAPTLSLASPAVTTGGVTYDKVNTPTITGSAEAGSTVTLKDGNTALGSTTANASGNYSFTPSSALSDAAHTLNVTATDAAGNESTVTSQTVTIDTAPPSAPSLSLASAVTVGGVTYDKVNTPAISGVAEGGATVTFKDGTTLLGTVAADANGNYTFTPTSALSDGSHTINVTATDKAGNLGAVASQSVTIDTAAPSAPTLSLASAVTSGGVTYDKDNKPTISGIAEAGSTVTVKDGTTVLSTVVADGSGNYTYTPTSVLSDGVHTINVMATDKAGNVGAVTSQSVTIDTGIPSTPSISVASAVTVGSVTYDKVNTPTISGTAEAGSTVTIKDGASTLGTVIATAGGTYSLTLGTALVDAVHTINVTAADKAGNVSSVASQSVTIDTAAPSAPLLSLSSAVTSGGVLYDKVNTPTISGTAEAGATVTFKDGTTLLGSTVAGNNNSYSFALTNALSDGVHTLNLTATDAAGNVSTLTSQSVTIDTAPPTAPTLSLASPAVTTGGVTYDKVNTPTITGSAEAGSTVTIKDGNTVLGTTTANASGNYSFTPSSTLSDAAHTLSVTATDAAGNVSTVTSQTVIIDTAPPSAPSLSLASAVTVSSVTYDKDNKPTISGVAEGGATVTLKDGTTLLGTAAADTNGSYTFIPTSALSDGSHTISVTATDAAGNLGAVASQTVLIDTLAPVAPTVALSTDSVGLGTSGSNTDKTTKTAGLSVSGAEAGALVEYSTNGTTGWSSTAPTATEGSNTVYVRQTDAAGNVSVASSALTYTLDTTAAAPTVALSADTFGVGTSGSNTDKTTKTAGLSVSGAEAGALVEYSTNGTSGWSSTAPTATEGSNTVYVRQTDAAGNVSVASSAMTYTLDTTAAAPTVVLSTDSFGVGTSGSNSDKTTKTAGLSVSGAEAGALVEYSTNGTTGWSSTAPTAVEGSNTVYVRQTDAAGNVSVASSALTYTLDTTVVAPTHTLASPAFTQGAVTYDSDNTPTITGRAEAGATVTLKDGATLLGTTVADSDGNYSFTVPDAQGLSDGFHTLTVGATDLAGNVSSVSSQTVKIDTTPPGAVLHVGQGGYASLTEASMAAHSGDMIYVDDVALASGSKGVIHHTDISVYITSGDGATLSLATGGLEVRIYGNHAFTLTGSTGDDIIHDYTHIAAGLTNSISGGDGNDSIVGHNPNSLGTLVYQGDGGNDTLVGGSQAQLFGGEGADVLLALGGAAYLSGGAGNDVLLNAYASADPAAKAVTLIGGAGQDVFGLIGTTDPSATGAMTTLVADLGVGDVIDLSFLERIGSDTSVTNTADLGAATNQGTSLASMTTGGTTLNLNPFNATSSESSAAANDVNTQVLGGSLSLTNATLTQVATAITAGLGSEPAMDYSSTFGHLTDAYVQH